MNETDNSSYVFLRYVDPNSLRPGLKVIDPYTSRAGEIIKIEYFNRGVPEILVVFDHSDTPVNAADYPQLKVEIIRYGP
jgi:hypothetical protein